MSVLYIANYHDPCAAFRALLDPDARFRILVLFGRERMGKTWLVQHFRKLLESLNVDHVGIDIEEELDNVHMLIRETVEELGKQHFSRYRAAREPLAGPLKQVVTDNRQYGIVNSIAVNLSLDPKDQERRLTEAWLEDLKNLTRPLLISVDAYERASNEEKAWFRASLLPAAKRAPFLRIVVAGRMEPEPHSSWSSLRGPVHELRGVPDAKHWMPIIAELNRRVPAEPVETAVQMVCGAVGGNPDMILKWIIGLEVA